MIDYYDSSALLSQRDENGNKPGIYISVTNRLGGKTYNYSRYMLRKYLKTGKTQGLEIRWNQDLKTRANSFASDVMLKDKGLRSHSLHAKNMGKIAYNIFMDDHEDRPAVTVIALNDSDKIRENSSKFQEICSLFLDEFQPETGTYVPDEVKRFQSIHKSIARGGDSFGRYVPQFMASNAASKINPYFVAMGIHKKIISKDQRFIRGKGWVLEQCVIEGAAEAQEQDPFNQAFEDSDYQKFSSRNEWLLDDSPFIKRLPITGKQIAIIDTARASFGLWYQSGIYYISDKKDPSGRIHIATTREAQNPGNVGASLFLARQLRLAYDRSCVYFSDPDSYAAFMSIFDSNYIF